MESHCQALASLEILGFWPHYWGRRIRIIEDHGPASDGLKHRSIGSSGVRLRAARTTSVGAAFNSRERTFLKFIFILRYKKEQANSNRKGSLAP